MKKKPKNERRHKTENANGENVRETTEGDISRDIQMRSGINKGDIQERYLLRDLRGGHMKLISTEGKSTMKEICKKIYLRYEEETFSQSLRKAPFPTNSKKEQLCGVALNFDSVSSKTPTFQ